MKPRITMARLLVALCLAACASIAVGLTAPAPANSPRIKVMTWNIYYGGGSGSYDLGSMFDHVEQTNFPQRAARIASIIDQQRPQVVCLQEAARWRVKNILGHQQSDIDFLAILQNRLLARGLRYDLIAALETIDFEAPTTALTRVHWEERIVMLVRRSPLLQVGPVRTRHYDDTESISTPVGDLRFNRGWIAADLVYRGRRARYVCTHLEAISSSTRAAQATQLIDWLSSTHLPVIVMGDLNALPASGVYQQFINADYVDAWAASHGLFTGPTGWQDPDLDNAASTLTARIDHVMVRGDLTAIASARVGQRQADRTPGGLWPSDHAGVVAKLELH